MARVDAVGDGPVVFGAKDGTRIEVPLAMIKFDNGQILTTRGNDANSADLLKWLQYLAMESRLTPGPAPAVAPAIVFTAANAGGPGNKIQITVTAKTATTVDIVVTSTDRYAGLTRDTLNAMLGTTTQAGTNPGLLRVKTNPGGAPPAANPKVPEDTPPTVPPTWTIAGTGATAAVLEPSYQGTGVTPIAAADVTVSLSDITAGQPTFTLTVVWTKTIADVAKTDLPNPAKLATPLAALVVPSPPPSGYALPRAGTITLSGGSEAAAAVQATATAPASA